MPRTQKILIPTAPHSGWAGPVHVEAVHLGPQPVLREARGRGSLRAVDGPTRPARAGDSHFYGYRTTRWLERDIASMPVHTQHTTRVQR